MTATELKYRRLDTGAVSWAASPPHACSRPGYLVSAAQTVFLGQRGDRTVNEPTSLTAYAVASGKQLWQRQASQPIHALTAVDDRGVLGPDPGREDLRRPAAARHSHDDAAGHSCRRPV